MRWMAVRFIQTQRQRLVALHEEGHSARNWPPPSTTPRSRRGKRIAQDLHDDVGKTARRC